MICTTAGQIFAKSNSRKRKRVRRRKKRSVMRRNKRRKTRI